MLLLHHIYKLFAGAEMPTLQDVDLETNKGEILCLLGPSGCGKTTLLRIIAGLEKADDGTVTVEGRAIDKTPVYKRGFGLMFQEFALFPHMNVGDNVMFGLRMSGIPESERSRRLDEVLELVGLQGFAERDVSQLSGGERQRVALARSLAPRPRLLMLDEPLGSVDTSLKERLITDVRRIIKQVGLTAIYVTHDQQEAFAIADRVAIMNAGRIEQIDTPQMIYQRPQTVFAARFLGLRNILTPDDYHALTGKTTLQNVLIHPDGMHMGKNQYTLEGEVVDCTFLGRTYRVSIRCCGSINLSFQTAARREVGQRTEVGFSDEAVIGLGG